MRLEGVFTALVTPFADGAVDRAAFTGLVERQLAAGVAGLVPCGTTGEAPTLERDEWTDLISTTVRLARGKVPVIAGCGTNSTRSTVEALAAARSLGADAGMIVFPYYNKPDPAGLRAHVEACARVGLPLVLYHVPGRTGQRLPEAQLAQLCNLPGVVALKEATGDVALGAALLDLTPVPILSGDDFTFPALVAMGGHGVISVLSNVAPRLTVAWDSAARAGDRAAVARLRTRLLPLVAALFARSNPIPVKAALAAQGLIQNELRLPLSPGPALDPALLAGLE